MKTKIFNVIPSEDATACILLYGEIGSYERVNAGDVVNELLELQRQYEHIDVRINSQGGEVPEGIAIYNALRLSTADITMYVDGIAASMAAVIALCGKPLYMSPYARLMIHNASAGVYGNASELRQTADEVEAYQDSLAKMISDRCGLTPDEVKEQYFDGKDHWISAQEALQMHLIDGIYELPDTGDKKPDTAEDVYKYFFNRLQFSNIKDENMALIDDIKKLSTFKDLSDSNAIVAKIKEIENKACKAEALEQAANSYKKEIGELKKTADDAFLNQAVKDGKITQEQIPQMQKLMQADRESTQALINSMKTASTPRASQVYDETSAKHFEGMTFDELDKQNLLKDVKENYPEIFKAAFKAKFKEDYKE